MVEQRDKMSQAEKSPTVSLPFITRFTLLARPALPILALATIPFCILCLYVSLSDLRAYPGRDLRPKVAGARLLVASRDPYDFNSPPPNDEYFKTNNPITFTPSLLLLYVPLSPLPYETQRMVYFALDLLFAAIAFYMLQRSFCRTRLEVYLCWIVYAAFIVCSYSFRLHLERGQYYVLLMLLTCFTASAIKSKRADWLSCMPSALLLVLRPTYGLLLFAALICFGARKWALRVSIITACFFLVTLQFGGITRWTGFLQVVQQAKSGFLEEAMSNCGQANYTSATYKQVVDVIENVNYHKSLAPHGVSGTVTGLFKSQSLSICRVLNPAWIDGINFLGMALVVAGGLLIAFMARSRCISPNILIAYMLLWPILFEIFSPERYLYTAVMEIVPVIALVFDEYDMKQEINKSVRHFALASILVLTALTPVAYQLVQNTKLAASAVSALILFAIPICTAAYCVYCISTSSKRLTERC